MPETLAAGCARIVEAMAGSWGPHAPADLPLPPIGSPERARLDAAQKAMIVGLLKVAAPVWTNATQGKR